MLHDRRAKDGVRTRDLDLGKVALYQLSYFRGKSGGKPDDGCKNSQAFETCKIEPAFFTFLFGGGPTVLFISPTIILCVLGKAARPSPSPSAARSPTAGKKPGLTLPGYPRNGARRNGRSERRPAGRTGSCKLPRSGSSAWQNGNLPGSDPFGRE